MNEIVNHKTISFCWPFGPRDSGPVGKPIMPHLRRYQGFAVIYYSVTLDALYLGHPRLSLNWRVTKIICGHGEDQWLNIPISCNFWGKWQVDNTCFIEYWKRYWLNPAE